jgi:WD40 repeat protein
VADEALQRWRGRPFVEVEHWEPGRIEAERLEELRRDTEELRLTALLEAGRYTEVLSEARARVAEAPLREVRWGLLATAQYQAGRQGEALAMLQRARETLREGLGLDLGPELVELERRILRHDPALLAGRAPEASSTCPYLGLRSYDAEDADRFFGRDDAVAACLDRLAWVGVLAVVGASGSGKSSLVRAGVVAALRRDARNVVVVTPGVHPLDALTALPPNATDVVLVVDQCEEAVTLCVDVDERAAFLTALVDHAARGPLVVVLRADRLALFTEHPAFATLLAPGLHLLPRMTEPQLREAIEAPARQAGLLLEGGLVDLLVRDVEDEPGALPLLSHALRETWLAREGRTLTVAGYQASGGIRGAVARTAEQVYEDATADQRVLLRELLLRLVVPNPDGEPSRTRVPFEQLASDREHERVVELLLASRLVTSDDEAIELAHDALLRAWPRLRSWLDEDVEGQRIRRHLTTAAETWATMGRPDSELYRGIRLARAVEWRDRTHPDLTSSHPDLTSTERTFLATSQERADADALASRRRRRALLSLVAAATSVVVLLGLTALVQARRATSERDAAVVAEGRAEVEAARAEGAAGVARSRELVAAGIAALETDPALAKLLALEAAQLGDQPSIENLALLHRVLAADAVVARYDWTSTFGADTYVGSTLHPDGRHVLLVEGDEVQIRDRVTDLPRWRWPDDPLEGIVLELSAFDPDGTNLVIGVVRDEAALDVDVPDGILGLHVRRVDDGSLVQHLDVGPCGGWVEGVSATHVSYNRASPPDCNPWSMTTTAALIELATGEERVLSEETYNWTPMSPDGRLVAFEEERGHRRFVIVVVDVATGEEVVVLDPSGYGFNDQDGDLADVRTFSPDGRWLLAGTRRVGVWDLDSGELLTTFAGHGGESNDALFHPDGTSVLTTGRDGGLWRWDARWGDVLDHRPAVGAGELSLSEDGLLLVGDVGSARSVLLDLDGRGELWSSPGCEQTFGYQLDAAGGTIVWTDACGDDNHTFVADATDGTRRLELPGHAWQHLAVAPDGDRLIRQEQERRGDRDVVTPPRIRDTTTGEVLVELQGVCTWQVPDDDGCAAFPDPPAPLGNWRLAWSPDGTMVAASRHPGVDGSDGALVWDATDGRLLHTADRGTCGTDVLFTPGSDALVLSCGGRLSSPALQVLDTTDFAEVAWTELADDVPGLHHLDLAGWTDDGATLVGVGQSMQQANATAVHWIDATSLEPVHSIEDAHDGSPKSYGLSPDTTLLATGSSDGWVRVWDLQARELVHEFSLGATQVQGVAFVDDLHLAVATEEGGIAVYTVDVDELLELVRSSLTRGFTLNECERYGFGDTCLTGGELRRMAGRS